MTWQEKVGFIYNPDTFEKKTFDYFKDIEGWGLTHNDKYLIMSDGSNTIYFLDPATQKISQIDSSIHRYFKKIDQLNELEWIDGKFGLMFTKKRCHCDHKSRKWCGRSCIKFSRIKIKK